MSVPSSLILSKPDDFHLHLRDGDGLSHTATTAAQQFCYATIMPNLQPPITTTEQAIAYRERILAAIKPSSSSSSSSLHSFIPLMTLYLTNNTTPEEIYRAHQSGIIYACKLYPAGATTHSSQGVTLHDDSALKGLDATFKAMAECGILLLIHGEVTDTQVDIFDRESEFLRRYLPSLMLSHPTLSIVLEHVTTAEAVAFVNNAPATSRIAATITAHHLLYNRNAIFTGGLNPHNYCLPILKAESHRLALLEAATSNSSKFFAGTDSAPHSLQRKKDEGCAGCYTAYAAIELYAMAFDTVGKLDVLEAFCCQRGRNFYGLNKQQQRQIESQQHHREQIELIRESWQVPNTLPFGKDQVVPFMAGKIIPWKIKGKQY